MKNKLERLAEEWHVEHPNGTVEDAFIAGYLRHVIAWVEKET